MDRFDDIWKNRFNEEDFPTQDWNEPSDKLWGSISQELPIEKKRKRRLFVWILFGALFFIGSLLIIDQCSMDKNIIISKAKETNQQQYKAISSSGKVETQKSNEVLDLQEVSKTKTLQVNDKDNTRSKTNFTQKLEKSNVVVNNSQTRSSNINSSANPIDKTSDDQQIISPKQRDNQFIEEDEIIKFIESKNGLNIPLRKNTRALFTPLTLNNLPSLNTSFTTVSKGEPLSLLKNRIGLMEDNLNDRLDYTEEGPDVHSSKSLKPFSISLNQGFVYWSHQLSENYSNALAPFDFDYTDNFGYQINISASYRFLKNFHAQIGVAYEQITVNSGHNSPLQYATNQEVGTDANNRYELPLATPYGTMNSDFALLRTVDVASENVDLNVDFMSSHQIKNISIPVGFTWFPIGDERKLKPFITTQFGINYLYQLKNNLEEIDTHHDALHYQSGSASLVDQTINNWHFDWRIGGGAQLFLTEDLDIQLNYNFAKGLSPLFKANAFDTHINRHLLTVGVNKRF